MAQLALDRKLLGVRDHWRALLLAEGCLWAGAAFAAAFLACFHLDRLFVLSVEARMAAWAVLLLLSALTAGLAGLLPAMRSRSPRWLASAVERRYPHLRERLLAAVELAGLP